MQGARQVRSRGIETVGIFVLPPSAGTLEQRLRGRSKDTEEQIRRLLSSFLTRRGYLVKTAIDGQEALKILESDVPDLVITDVNMPNVDGVELTRRLRAHPRLSSMPIIMLSAKVQTDEILAGYAEDFMASSVYEGLTVGYCLALTQFLMVFVLGIMYLKRSDRDYDPLAQRVVDMAERGELTTEPRFEREPAATPTTEATR